MAATLGEARSPPAAPALFAANSSVDQGFHPEEILLDPMDAVGPPHHEPLDDVQIGTVLGKIAPGLEIEVVGLSPADEGLVADLREGHEPATRLKEKAIRSLRHSGRGWVEDV